MSKKGDLSMSTIVMAVLAIIILVVLSSIVIRNLGNTSQELARCPGTCTSYTCSDLGEERGASYQEKTDAYCYSNGEVDRSLSCCLPG